MVTIPKSGIITAVYVMIRIMQNSHLHPSPLSMRSVAALYNEMRHETNESNVFLVRLLIIDIGHINFLWLVITFLHGTACA